MKTLLQVGLALFLGTVPLASCADNCPDSAVPSQQSEMRQLATCPMEGSQQGSSIHCLRGPSQVLVQGPSPIILHLPVYAQVEKILELNASASVIRSSGAATQLAGSASPFALVLRV